MKTLKHIGLFLIVILITGCSSSAKKENSETKKSKSTSSSKPTEDPSKTSWIGPEIKSQDEGDLCKLLLKWTNFFIHSHISRQPEEEAALVKNAFDMTDAKLHKAFSKPSLKTEIDRIYSNIQINRLSEPEQLCKQYLAIAENVKTNVALRSAMGNSHDDLKDFDKRLIRNVLRNFVHLLDGVSFYLSDSELDHLTGENPERFGAGLILHDRTDYHLGRNPPYIWIKDIWETSQTNFKVHRNNLKERRLYGLEAEVIKWDTKAATIKILDQTINLTFENETSQEDILYTVDQKTFLKTSFLGYEGLDHFLNGANDDNLDESELKKTRFVRILLKKKDSEAFEIVNLHMERYTPRPVFVERIALNENYDALYLQVLTFMNESMLRLLQSEIKLVTNEAEKTGRQIRGVLLDLRRNSGGLDTQAEMLWSLFLHTRTKTIHDEFTTFGFALEDLKPFELGEQNEKQTFFRDSSIIYGYPNYFTKEQQNLVVIVDRSSVSNAESTTAVLKDYDKAWIVGENTFGKGLKMQRYALSEAIGGYAFINQGYFYSPKGIPILMNPYFIDYQLVDPVNQEIDPNGKGIYDALTSVTDDGSLSIPMPKTPEVNMEPTHGEDPWVNSAMKSHLSAFSLEKPEACKKTPQTVGEDFHEYRDDCLFEVGKAYLHEMIRLRDYTP
ncbi:MAG: hypothetical protein KDD48_06430 [Bdellovibrionales bacterium]|nr:hypothetical protein [Bdellovibrionales bacterium]